MTIDTTEEASAAAQAFAGYVRDNPHRALHLLDLMGPRARKVLGEAWRLRNARLDAWESLSAEQRVLLLVGVDADTVKP